MNQNLLYKFHQKQFKKIEKDLEKVYSNYTNKRKIITLLESWLFFSLCLTYAYSDSVIDRYIKYSNKITSLLFFDDYLHNIPFRIKKAKIVFPFLIICITSLIFKKINLKGAYLRNFFDKFIYKLDFLALRNINLQKNYDLQNKVINILLKKYAHNNVMLRKMITSKLPDIFYSNQIFLCHNFDIICDGSSHSFMDFDGYEKILLLRNNLIIYGRQHGGGYNTYLDDLEIDYELKLCDKFYGWGLYKNNTNQHKFKLDHNFDNNKKIIWVERANQSIFFRLYSENKYNDFCNTKPIIYINKELSNKADSVYNLIHRNRYCDLYEDFRFNIINNESRPGEYYLKKGNLVIFDNLIGTLLYFCIFNDISFIIVTSRYLSKNYSKKMKRWVDLLRKNNQLFFDDEKNALKKYVNNYFKLT